jgi:hypothetical protein
MGKSVLGGFNMRTNSMASSYTFKYYTCKYNYSGGEDEGSIYFRTIPVGKDRASPARLERPTILLVSDGSL